MPANTSGCGPGIVTGKLFPDDAIPSSVNAGGIPLYRVTARAPRGSSPTASSSAPSASSASPAIRSARSSPRPPAHSRRSPPASCPVPFYPLPEPGNVFIDGIRLPFLGPDLRLTFNDDGLPNGVAPRRHSRAGTDATARSRSARSNGGCAANEYLVGPRAGSTAHAAGSRRASCSAPSPRRSARAPRSACRSTATRAWSSPSPTSTARSSRSTACPTRRSSPSTSPSPRRATSSTSAATASPASCPAAPRSRTARSASARSRSFRPASTPSVFDPREGPWYQLALPARPRERLHAGRRSSPNPNQNGVVFFAGSSPLYRNGTLVGGLGVSGDGIEQDDYVTYFGAGEFLPAARASGPTA